MSPEKPKDMAFSGDGGTDCTTDVVVVSAPVRVRFVGKKIQVYFIGDKSDVFPIGVAEGGRIPGRIVLQTRHPSGSGTILLWSGVDPVCGAQVFISWLIIVVVVAFALKHFLPNLIVEHFSMSGELAQAWPGFLYYAMFFVLSKCLAAILKHQD